MLSSLRQHRFLLSLSIAFVFVLAVACGSSATSTPRAADTAAPAATAAPQPTNTLMAERSTPAPQVTATTPPVTAGKPKVNRLIAAMPMLQETYRAWAGPWSLLQQHVPFADPLLRNDPTTGEAGPGLALSWEISDDFTQWSFNLRKDAQFHNGWGEFTSADVIHTHERMSQDDAVATMGPVWRVATSTANGDHEVTFDFGDTPYLDGLRLFSRTAGDLYIMSNAQWQAEGLDGYDENPAGTGHYRVLERKQGLSLSFETADTEPWDGVDPDFPEFQLSFITEDATRMAVLLAGDAHMANLSRDLQAEALKRGMKTISSQQPTIQTVAFMLGQYFLTGDESYKAGMPVENIKVRQAMNLAVNRADIMEYIYKGSGTPVYVYGFTPGHEGWDPRYEADFEANYGYDPDRAIALLAEAGYGPGEIEIDFPTMNFSGNPELSQIAEAIQLDFEAVGIKANLQEMEYTALRPDLVSKQAWGKMWMSRNLPLRTTQEAIRVFYADEGVTHAAGYDELEAMYNELKDTIDPADRERIAKAIGNFAFDNFISIPIAQIFYELTVDPDVVDEYIFSGQTPTSLDHIHLIKGVR